MYNIGHYLVQITIITCSLMYTYGAQKTLIEAITLLIVLNIIYTCGDIFNTILITMRETEKNKNIYNFRK